MAFPFDIKDPLDDAVDMGWTPFGRHIGLKVYGFSDDEIYTGLAWREELIGNPQNMSVHGGVITALIDQSFGAAVIRKLQEHIAIATIELRLDYMRPAKPYQDIYCRATCYHTTRQIAFLRGSVFQDDPEKPIASGVATFMINANRSAPSIDANREALMKRGGQS